MNSSEWPYITEPMRVADIPTVVVIERMVYSRPWPVEAYRYEIVENSRSHYIVARLKGGQPPRPQQGLRAALRRAISGPEIDETLLGYGGLWLMVDEAHISTLAVHTKWQGKGIGELLLTSLIAKAAEMRAAYITLEVRVSNIRAQNLYEKYGFRKGGLRHRYYSDNNEDALIMTTGDPRSSQYQVVLMGLLEALDAKLRTRAATVPSSVREEL